MQQRAPGAALRCRPSAWASGSPRGTHPGRTTSTSGSSTPSTTTGCARSCAGSRSATTPGACTSTSASAAPTGRSRSATTFAGCSRRCSRCPRTRRSSTARTPACLGAHRDLHPHLPALRRPRAVRRLGDLRRLRRAAGADRARSSRRPSCGGACARITVRDGRAADLRRPDPRRGVVLARGDDHRLHRPDGARLRRRAARRRRCASARSRRTSGGRSATASTGPDRLRAPRGDPDADALERLLEWTEPARDALGLEVELPTETAPSARGEALEAGTPLARRLPRGGRRDPRDLRARARAG